MDASSAPPPLLIAHRAANDLDRLRHLRAIPADAVEADVHHYRGRLEIRHSKTIGPLRLLWDRHPWRLENPFTHQLTLDELLPELAPGENLMLDLKGINSSLVAPVIAAIEEHLPDREVAVCSRNWQILPRFSVRPWARVWYSVGNRAQVRAIFGRIEHADAVVIDHTLLSPALTEALRARVPRVICWTVDDPERWATLASWGVNGVITDDPATLARAMGRI